MAQQTINLSYVSCTYVDHEYPNTAYNYPEPEYPNYYYLNDISNKEKMLLIQFSAPPSAMRNKKLIYAHLVMQTQSSVHALPLMGTFTRNVTTWNTMPQVYQNAVSRHMYITGSAGSNWRDIEYAGSSSFTAKELSQFASLALQYRALALENSGSSAAVRDVLTNGTSRPYLIVVYDDAVTVTSKISATEYPTGNAIDPRSTQTFKWDYDINGDYSRIDGFTQASAKLYWRKQSASTWNQISISGSTKQTTVAANTFPSGSTVEWYLSGTDTEGTTSTTSTLTFSTISSQITPDSYPSGNNVDNRVAYSFTWHFASSAGNFSQGSARLYWRKSGASTWNQRNASGSTQSLSVPAYTFPADSTIEWYLYGTDVSGTVSNSATASFKTLAYSLAMTNYPSGSNVDPRSAITFTWTISNTQGAATQSSAIFYWRKQGASSWNQINVSGNAKSVTVPGNTFPSGASVQWYLKATASDGTELTGSTMSFTTVTPKLTMVTYPSGNAVDFGVPQSWTWTITSTAGDHTQQSATLYWRKSTSDPWTEVSVSGSTKSVTVPANTFPSTSPIQWYLSATDIGGTVMTSSTSTFTTVSPQITPQDCPTSGYADPRNAITFSWYFSTGSSSYGQQSATLHWRVQGASTWNNVNASGSTQHVTIAANTFPLLSVIEWYLSGTDIGGTSSETEVYSFSTSASPANAICKDPVGKAEDGSKPITLKWIVQNADGSAATRTIVQWKLPSESQSQWHGILDTTEAVTETTVAANTFPAGPIEWRVTAYNRDNVAGPTSQASFVCIAAPEAPTGLTATAVPMTEIHWQSEDQEAYEIKIDGAVAAYGFGSGVYSYSVKEPLADGVHTITVRVQGTYGLWSDETETTVLIENVPVGTITAGGRFETDAVIYWEYDGGSVPVTIAVYRDGKWIGTANGQEEFKDRFVLGEHDYIIEYRFASGNYTRSDAVTGNLSCEGLKIAAFDGGEWLDLKLTENDNRVFGFNWNRTSAVQHITASKYPILELSPYEDLTGSFECAFQYGDGKEFEKLYGKTVILKSRPDAVLIGAITNMDKRIGPFYVAYGFKVEQIQWEDFVSYDANT